MFECVADTDFGGNWNKALDVTDTSTTMEDLLTLSNYNSLREIIPIMEMLNEFRDYKYKLVSTDYRTQDLL